MLSHSNWMSTANLYEQVLDFENPPVIVFMFLPLAHSLARIIQMVTIDVGGTLAFWQRDPQRLLEDIREVSPTHLTSVPRVFEKIFTAASAGVAEQSAVNGAIFRWALGDRARGSPARAGVGRLAAPPPLRAGGSPRAVQGARALRRPPPARDERRGSNRRRRARVLRRLWGHGARGLGTEREHRGRHPEHDP